MPAKPNILVIWGDDIGITDLSCYSDGLMGYRTPNIDRIADEGIRFTDHLNADEDPESPNYPPRGMLHSWATEEDNPTEEPRWGRAGKQRIQATGPPTKKRMETVDDDITALTEGRQAVQL
jgi:hypothetical protein